MGLLPRALSSSDGGGGTPIPTTAKALWNTKVVLTAVDVANKYFDLPTDAPNIAVGFGPNVIVTVETTVQYTPRSYLATTNEAGALRRITWNGMDLENDPPLQAGDNLWVIYPVQITLEGSAGTYNHDELVHRDYVDQHPIDAITGLRDALTKLTSDISNIIIDNTHYKGWFEDEAALNAAHPTAEPGDFATVGDTKTIWLWDSVTSAWVDTGTTGEVSSITTPVGGKETGDVIITINKLGLTGDPAQINDAVTKSHTHANKALLDSLISSGDGTKFLNNKGQYVDPPGGGDMYKADYDPDGDGSVNLADTIRGYTRNVIVNLLQSAGYLVTNGDGTKFLNDKGQYVAQTAFWDRWRENQEVQLNEISSNGKRFWGKLLVCRGTITETESTPFHFPLNIPGYDPTDITVDRADIIVGSESSFTPTNMALFPLPYSQPDIPGATYDRYIIFGLRLQASNAAPIAAIWCSRFWAGFPFRARIYLKYTKLTDSPIV